MSGKFNQPSFELICVFFFFVKGSIQFIVLKVSESDTEVWSFIDCPGILCDLSLNLTKLDSINLNLNKINGKSLLCGK